MNYRWYEPTRSFFASTPPFLTASQYVAALDSIATGIPEAHLQAMMNLTASHDSPRFGTSIYNPGRYKHQVNPRENPDFKIDKPDLRTREIQEMILVQQFTYIGAPHIWYGDEVGMWGGDDPDPRKPMVWGDLVYEPEMMHPMGGARRASLVAPDPWLRGVYQRLIDLRQGRLRLFVDGSLEWVLTSDANRLLAYRRSLGDQQVIVAFNASEDYQEIEIPAKDGAWHTVYQTGRYSEGEVTGITDVVGGTLAARMRPLSARVWMRH
jgi:cyclomaltodextrinase